MERVVCRYIRGPSVGVGDGGIEGRMSVIKPLWARIVEFGEGARLQSDLSIIIAGHWSRREPGRSFWNPRLRYIVPFELS
ncbi:MAG: hypothetical protein OXJ37_10410 [Bryobacterales bacterium]|nr:hypothetical protein [Bryobacterales bacterium]